MTHKGPFQPLPFCDSVWFCITAFSLHIVLGAGEWHKILPELGRGEPLQRRAHTNALLHLAWPGHCTLTGPWHGMLDPFCPQPFSPRIGKRLLPSKLVTSSHQWAAGPFLIQLRPLLFQKKRLMTRQWQFVKTKEQSYKLLMGRNGWSPLGTPLALSIWRKRHLSTNTTKPRESLRVLWQEI